MPRTHLVASLAVEVVGLPFHYKAPIRSVLSRQLRRLAASGITNACDHDHIFGSVNVFRLIGLPRATGPKARTHQRPRDLVLVSTRE